MNEASAKSSRLPNIDRGTLPASMRAQEPIASFFFEDIRPMLVNGRIEKDPFAARVVLLKEADLQRQMPQVQSEVQIFGAPQGALSTREGWEDIPEGFFFHFLDWLNLTFKVPISCRGAAVQQGGLLGKKKARELCEESGRPITGVHRFGAGIWMTLAPLKQMSAHAALELHAVPEIEYLDPAQITY